MPVADVGEDEAVLELPDRLRAEAEGHDEHGPARVELDQVEAAERRRVLVLLPALDPDLDPLDPVGEVRDLVVVDRQPEPLRDRRHEGHRDRRRRAETRPGRRVVVEDDLEAAIERLLSAEVIDHALRQVELPIVDEGVVDAVADALVVVDAADRDVLPARDDGRRGVSVDRRAEDDAPALVAVRGDVRPPAAEADAKRRPGADQHGSVLPAPAGSGEPPTCSKIRSITRDVSRISRYGIGGGVRSRIER